MKCQILFSGKNKKNSIILSSAENAQRVVKVKPLFFYMHTSLFVGYLTGTVRGLVREEYLVIIPGYF